MILGFDIGNTHTVVGVFDGDELIADWRLTTDPLRTGDETAVSLQALFGFRKLDFSSITGVVACSVVPPALDAIERMSRKYLGFEPIIVGPGVKTGIPILYENPREVGADRIVNAVAGVSKYPCPMIIVDFGTATTFDCINAKGEYLGGVIVPGLNISVEALATKASKLPRIEIARPPAVIGRTTVHSMQSGLFHGSVSMMEGLLQKLSKEMKGEPTVIATGGLAHLIAAETPMVHHIDAHLTMFGLLEIYKKNTAG